MARQRLPGVLGWDKAIVTPEGEPASVHGMEYDSYYGSGLLAFAFGATVEKDPVSAALEEQAALMHRRQARAVAQYDYHRNSWAKAAAAYLWHKFEGPRAEPLPLPAAMAALRGTYHFKWQNNVVQRTDGKFASFAWGAMLYREDEDDTATRAGLSSRRAAGRRASSRSSTCTPNRYSAN